MPPDHRTTALSAPASGGSTPQLSASERAAQRKHKDLLKSFNEKAKGEAKSKVRGIDKYRDTNRDDPVQRKRMDARVSKEKTKFYIKALEDYILNQLLRSERTSPVPVPVPAPPSLPRAQPTTPAPLPAHVQVAAPASVSLPASSSMPFMQNEHAITTAGPAYGAPSVLNVTHMNFALNDPDMMDVDSRRKDREIERQRAELDRTQRINLALQRENNLLKSGQVAALIPQIITNIGFGTAAGNVVNPAAQPSNVPMIENNDVMDLFAQNTHPNMNALMNVNNDLLPPSVANSYPVNPQDDTMTTTTATTTATTATQQQVDYKITKVEEETSAPDMDLTNDHSQLLSLLPPFTPTIRTVKFNLEVKIRQENPSMISNDPAEPNPLCLPSSIFEDNGNMNNDINV